MATVDYKKLLLSNMRNTRWGEWVEAYQDIIDNDLIPDKIDIILDQFNIDEMTSTDFQNIADKLGFPLFIAEGYTNTTKYFKRELLSIVPKIINKTAHNSYLYELHIFSLRGEVYPLLEEGGYLIPKWDWWTSNENPAIINILDSGDDNLLYYLPTKLGKNITKLDEGYKLDTLIPTYDNPKSSGLVDSMLDEDDTNLLQNLDQESFIINLTRSILLTYSFTEAETSTAFLDDNSLLAFYNDTILLKRKTERIYFEPKLKIYFKTDNSLVTTTYPLLDGTGSTNQYSMLISGDISLTRTIKIGDSAHTTINGSITNVDNEILSLDRYNDMEEFISEDSVNGLALRKNLQDFNKFIDFTEIALLDEGGNCLLYATFPEVKYNSKMYSNISFDFISQ